MSHQVLTNWIKMGYPYFKEGIGLPLWVLPERSLKEAADKLGDEDILKLGQSIGLINEATSSGDKILYPDKLSAEDWQMAIALWPPQPNAKSIIEALLEAVISLTAQLESINHSFDPLLVSRNLAVIALAPFTMQGKPLIDSLAFILKTDGRNPSDLIRRYAEAMINKDTSIVDQIDACIAQCGNWAKWAEVFQHRIISLNYHPKLVAVSPPSSPELIGVLALMAKEENHDEA